MLPRFLSTPAPLFTLSLLVVLAALLPADGSHGAEPEECPTLMIRNVHILTMRSPEPTEPATVVIIGDRIDSIVPGGLGEGREPSCSDAREVDGDGGYLLPGLVDFHVHLRDEGELASYLTWGVTSVVNMRGGPAHLKLREAIRLGEILGPTLYTTGPTIDGDPPIRSGANTRVVTEPAEARAVAREHAEAGYDLMKVYNNLPPEAFRVLVDEAHRLGLSVVGHIPRTPGRAQALQFALDAGLDMITHGEEYFFTYFGGASDAAMATGGASKPDMSAIPEVARMTAEAGTAVTPNLSFVEATRRQLENLDAVLEDPETRHLPPAVLEMWRSYNPTQRDDLEAFTRREAVKQPFVRRLTHGLHEAGVLLLAGTDASAPGLFPGRSLHLELRELVGAGLTPYEALATATRNAGAFAEGHLDLDAGFGTIEEGHRADLLLLEENPFASVDALDSIEGLAVRGRWHDADDLRPKAPSPDGQAQ